MLRVLHLVGSAQNELLADLSRLYARDCLAATADEARYEHVVAHVAPGGGWSFPADLSPAAIAAAPVLGLGDAVDRIGALAPDVAVPQMFCLPGMTRYRGLLDLLGLPYVGNTPEVMALTAHKARAKAVVAAAGVRVPAGELVGPGGNPTLATPAVVKPVDADNSLGVTLVRDAEDYPAAVATALEHSAHALVETYVELGREVRCGVLDRGGVLTPLPLEEYRVLAGARGPADKLARDDGGDLRLVAKQASRAWIVDPADPVTAPVWEAALACHVALGARHYSLFDVRVDPSGVPWFLEAGMYCSFAEQSVVSVMARAAGVPLPELFASMLAEALS